MRRILTLLCLTAVSLPLPVDARSGYVSGIPHGACDRCHIVPGGPRNDFGLDVQRTLRGGPNWQALYDLDSDGDGFTNGQELGDPDGLFPGEAPGPMLSEPGDANSFPTPVGEPPTAEDSAYDIDEDEVLEGTLDGDDPDGDTLRFRISSAPELGNVQLNDRTTGAFTYTPRPGISGTDTFIYRVSDGFNVSAQAEVTIEIAEVNDPPVFRIDDSYRISEGRRLTFRARVDDEEDGELVPELRSDLPEGAEFDDEEGRFSWTPGPEQSGDYVLSLLAEDSEGLATDFDVDIEVVDVNAIPTIDEVVAPETGREGESLHFLVEASDADGDELTYTWRFPDADEDLEGVDLTEVDHTFGDDGRFTVAVDISDGIDTVTQRLVVEVENVAPTVDAGDDITVKLGEEVLFSGSFTDPGAEEYTTRWNFGDGTPVANDTLTPTHSFVRVGDFTVVLSVSDGTARIDDALTVTVTSSGAGNNGGVENNGAPGNNGAPNTCTPGETKTCVCSDARFGTSLCDSSGALLPCSCGTPPESEPDEGCQTSPGTAAPAAALWLLLGVVLVRLR